MKRYFLKISSKNEKSLNSFLFFFLNCLNNKFNVIQKMVSNNSSKRIITLLKSPHVNKAAQEQFEIRFFSKKLLAESFDLEKNLIFIKTISNKLFKDVSINLQFKISKNENFINNLFIFCPDNFKLSSNKVCKTNLKRIKQKKKSKTVNDRKNSLFTLKKFLSTVSVYGEILTVS